MNMIDSMNKIEFFSKEIEYIKNLEYVDDFKFLINNLPDYFFKVAASSTGKYHPEFSLGDGGLLRHTKAAIRIAYELLNDSCIGGKYSNREKDLMIIALALHDGIKHGNPEEKFTRADHPLLACKYIRDNKNNLKMKDEDIDFICEVIEAHMGPWNTHPYTKEEILPIPKNKFQNFVHMCDYLASRKFLDIKFENNEIVD